MLKMLLLTVGSWTALSFWFTWLCARHRPASEPYASPAGGDEIRVRRGGQRAPSDVSLQLPCPFESGNCRQRATLPAFAHGQRHFRPKHGLSVTSR